MSAIKTSNCPLVRADLAGGKGKFSFVQFLNALSLI